MGSGYITSLISPITKATGADQFDGNDLNNLVKSQFRTRVVTANYTATINDDNYIECDCTSAAITVTLPPVSNCDGKEIIIAKTDAGGNAVTIDGNSAETIDGSATQSLANQWDTIFLKCNGISWKMVFLPSGAGTVTGASNVGTGQGVFKALSVTTLQFYNILANSSKISVGLSSNDIVIDVVQANLDLNSQSGTLAATRGGTSFSTYTLGDIIYSSASNTLSKLAGNTSATKKFLAQTGNGVISAAPAWATLVSGDMPSNTVKNDQANTYTAGAKQTVSHSATTAGFNLGPVAGDPSAPANGDMWYNSTTGKFRKRENGATSDIGSGSGSVSALDDLSDVAITAATNGQILRHNGTNFVNASLVIPVKFYLNVNASSSAAVNYAPIDASSPSIISTNESLVSLIHDEPTFTIKRVRAKCRSFSLTGANCILSFRDDGQNIPTTPITISATGAYDSGAISTDVTTGSGLNWLYDMTGVTGGSISFVAIAYGEVKVTT